MTLLPLHSITRCYHQHHSALLLLTSVLLLALLSSCAGNDIVCEDQQDFQNCIMMLNNNVLNTIEGECTSNNSRAVLKGSTVSVDCDFPTNVGVSIEEWLYYPSTDPQETPLPDVEEKYEFSRDNDRLTIFDVQPDDEGLYVCRIRQGNTATDTVGGCVIITAMTSELPSGTVVQVPVSIYQDNIVLPTELTFPDGGFCNVRPVILTFEVHYTFEMEDFVTIVNCSHSFSPCVLSDGVEYVFQDLGNVTVPVSLHGAGLYVLDLSQTCPGGVVRITYDVTFTPPAIGLICHFLQCNSSGIGCDAAFTNEYCNEVSADSKDRFQQHCQATYKLRDDGIFEPRFLSCFAGNFECTDDQKCILELIAPEMSIYHCCCRKNYCNAEETLLFPSNGSTTPHDTPADSVTAVSTEPSETATADTQNCTGTDCSSSSINAGVVAAMVIATLIVAGVVIIVGALCIMKRIDCYGVIKVADFGLTEDMYSTSYYRRGKSESEEKVPIRWMAPESVEENIYNEATDVMESDDVVLVTTFSGET